MIAITGKITVSQHAIDRVVERFRVPRQTADEWIRSNLRKATFVANVVTEDGKPNRLYAYQRMAFALDVESNHVITVYAKHDSVTTLQRKINAILKRELAAAERRERVTERRVRIEKARIAMRIAECKLRMELTPSKSVVARNTGLITQYNEKIAQLDDELFAARYAKSSVAKSLVTYL